ncbi:MAG: hypothetical protein WED10_14675 [Brumimicrobium sp.]
MLKIITTTLLVAFTSFLFGQDQKKYIITFEDYDQKEIKEVIGVMNPLFKSSVNSDGTNFLKLFYISDQNVTEEELKAALENKGFTYKELKIEDND